MFEQIVFKILPDTFTRVARTRGHRFTHSITLKQCRGHGVEIYVDFQEYMLKIGIWGVINQ